MATHLDLEEQEQLDQLKAFWKQYGNLITWVVILALGGYVAWTVWHNRQQEQAVKASVLYDELDKAAKAGDLDKSARVFADMKERFAGAGYTQQAALLLAKLQFDKGQADASALKQLDATPATECAALAADRRGDVLLAQGKTEEAKVAYNQAWKAMDETVEYRRLIDAKLTALGAAPGAPAAAPVADAGASK